MKTAADTSVLVAAFASWHEQHQTASAALERVDAVVAHALLETYSVLTRLPAPPRMLPAVVSKFLDLTCGRHAAFALTATEQRKLVATCAARGLSGGAVYDAVIGATCVRAGLRLLTLDGRAQPTYAMVGAEHELLT
ncbi:MAG: PIN domain-containing protein [Polyangiaceae bacterium]